MDVKDFYEYGQQYFLPNLSIDIVIIGYEQGQLKCLLLKMGEKWLLPGGYIPFNQSVDEAVKNILEERTGLTDPHVKFLSVFGDKDRTFKEEWPSFLEKAGLEWREDLWFNTRFVTLAYYSLVDIQHTHPVVKNFDEAFGWFSFEDLPEIWMDHRKIVLEARNRLKEDIRQEQVSYNLLPDPFTMPDLHQLHQTILEEKIDRSRFQKKMISTGLFKRLPKVQNESPGRNPYQYTVKED